MYLARDLKCPWHIVSQQTKLFIKSTVKTLACHHVVHFGMSWLPAHLGSVLREYIFPLFHFNSFISSFTTIAIHSLIILSISFSVTFSGRHFWLSSLYFSPKLDYFLSYCYKPPPREHLYQMSESQEDKRFQFYNQLKPRSILFNIQNIARQKTIERIRQRT